MTERDRKTQDRSRSLGQPSIPVSAIAQNDRKPTHEAAAEIGRTISLILQRERLAHGHSLRHVSDALPVQTSVASLHAYESDPDSAAGISASRLVALFEFYGASLNELDKSKSTSALDDLINVGELLKDRGFRDLCQYLCSLNESRRQRSVRAILTFLLSIEAHHEQRSTAIDQTKKGELQ